MFVINCKNYEEVAGNRMARLVKTAEKVSKKYRVRIAVAPPQHQVGQVAGCGIPVLAQHVDDSDTGGTTGFVVPELLKRSGVAGSLINHSEHRITTGEIRALVPRLRALKMTSVLCVRDVAEVKRYAGLNPDYIAIEPPGLIGSGRAVSKERPDLIVKAADAVRGAKNGTRLLCGAGIVSGHDVAKAVELGSGGILVASGIIRAKNWEGIISEFAESMRQGRRRRTVQRGGQNRTRPDRR